MNIIIKLLSLSSFLLSNYTNQVNSKDFFQIATQITTPLGLAGLFITTFYLIYRLIFKSKIFSRISRDNTFKIIDKTIFYLFLLSLILSLLGFVGFLFEKIYPDQKTSILTHNMTIGIHTMRYDSQNHIFKASPIFDHLSKIDINYWNLYLGINKYNDRSDRLNQKYIIIGPFNLRNDIGEQEILLEDDMINYLTTGGKIRVCYFLINKFNAVNIDNFVPSEYNPGIDLKEICGFYGFDDL